MHIDWFTVGAQVVNFLVLVWLLKRYLYKPIVQAIAAREARTAAELADADAKEQAATERKAQYEKMAADLATQSVALQDQARQAAAVERERLLADARRAADRLRDERERELRSEVDALGKVMGQRVCTQVMAIARKTLADLADTDLDGRIGTLFTQRLLALDPQARAALTATAVAPAGATAETAAGTTAGTTTGPTAEPAPGPVPGSALAGAQVRSAFALPQAQRDAIAGALGSVLGVTIPIRFDLAPELIGGIELTANGQRVSWNIADYVATMARMASVDLERVDLDGPESAPAAA